MQRERKDQPMTFEAALPPPLWWWVVVRLVVVVAAAAAGGVVVVVAAVVVVVVLLSTSNATQIYWVVVLLVVLAPPVLQVLLPVPLALLVLLVPYFCAGDPTMASQTKNMQPIDAATNLPTLGLLWPGLGWPCSCRPLLGCEGRRFKGRIRQLVILLELKIPNASQGGVSSFKLYPWSWRWWER